MRLAKDEQGSSAERARAGRSVGLSFDPLPPFRNACVWKQAGCFWLSRKYLKMGELWRV
jgi:hypothetical protein